jgi:chitinase
MRKTRLLVTAAIVVAAGAPTAWALGVANASSTSAPKTTAAVATGWYGAAAYVMPLENDPPNLATVMAATGQKTFELAFILAQGSACTPAWDGTAPVASDTAVGAVINSVRAAGGDVSISVGGYGGTKLGQVCGTPAATAAAYQQVISKYSIKAIDLDLEEPEYENATAVANELGAAKILQANNPGLYVSITTAGTAAGTGWFGTEMLKQAKSIGFTPDNYSIMPFDGGFNGSASQISALEAFHTILMNTFGWDSATAYAREGVSLMNGRSDIGEYFYESDFAAVLAYVNSHKMSRYTFWSVNRDRACPTDNGTTSGTCSSVKQSDWAFTKYTASFGGGAPDPSPTATTSPTSPTMPPSPTASPTASPTQTPGGSCPAAWSATKAYNGTDKVSYGGHVWTAKWWTYGDTPGGAAGVWVDGGPC